MPALLRSTLRQVRKRPGFALINVGGLGVGVAACLLIGLYLHHEASYDRFHTHAERTYRVVETFSTPEGLERHADTAGPVGPALADEVAGVEAVVRLTSLFRFTVERGANRFYVGDYLFAEPSFFDVFSFPLAQGDASTALSEPGTVVLTDASARRYFGDEDAVGQTLQTGLGDVTVSGVLAPLPAASHLQFSMLFPFASPARDADFWTPWVENWTPNFRAMATYVVLEAGADPAEVEAQLMALLDDRMPDAERPEAAALQPLLDVHLFSEGITDGYNARPGSPVYLWLFGGIALLIVGVAAINYTNLVTALGLRRAAEIGVRKTVGASRGQLARQFLGEALVLTALAFGVGLLLAQAALPTFADLAGVPLSLGVLLRPGLLALLAVGLLGLALVAGGYPAFYLARFDPARALRGRGRRGEGARLRRALVVTQFALSVVMIAAALVAARQLDYVQEKRLGFDAEHLVAVDINSGNVRQAAAAMKAEMAAHPAVERVALSSRLPGDWKDLAEVEVARAGASAEEMRTAFWIGIDADFLDTFGMTLLAGRPFDPARGTDSLAVIVNETAADALGLSDPVGQAIRVPVGDVDDDGTEDVARYEVVGIVEDFHVESLHEPVRPLVLGYDPAVDIDYFTLRAAPGQVAAAIEHARGIVERVEPGQPFEYNLLDARLAEVYEADRRVGRLFGLAAGLAVVIACVGLLGLAAFSAQQRTKEIGVRKVLGASVRHVVLLLSREFARLVLVAAVVAVPLAYLLADRWLSGFAYRVDLGVGVFALAGALAFAVALATVGALALRAATTDPVQALRYE